MFFTNWEDKLKKLKTAKTRRAYYWRNREHILELAKQGKIKRKLRD